MSLLITFIIATAVIFLAVGSYFDLKTGEIPEKISYGFISLALIIAASNSILNSDIQFFLNSLFLGTAFFIIGLILFYLGQWGGGDVKLMAGIGCTLGYLAYANYFTEGFFPYYLTYFINMGFIALPYVIIYGLILGIKNPETKSEFMKYWKDIRTKVVFLLSFLPSIFAFSLGQNSLGILYLFLPPLMISALYLKAVEMTALQQVTDVIELHEGDIVAEDLIIENEKIASKRNIEGLSDEDIQKIQRLALDGKIPSKIKIKEGIRFAPILFLTFLSILWIGNLMEISLEILV